MHCTWSSQPSDRATGLRGNNFAGAQPTRQHVEEMHAMLDEDSAALLAIPEPMLRRKILVGGVVLEVAVQEFAKRLAIDDLADDVEQRVVSLHQVRDEQSILSPRERDQLVGLFDRQRERLLADDVLARLRVLAWIARNAEMAAWRCRPNRPPVIRVADRHRRRPRAHNAAPLPGPPAARRAGHSSQPHSRNLHELLQREQPEAATTDNADTELVAHHFESFRPSIHRMTRAGSS